MAAMRFLFVKHTQSWPHTCGHDIRCYQLLRTLQELGHAVGLATVAAPDPRALRGLRLDFSASLDAKGAGEGLRLTGLRERYRSYWGVEPRRIAAVKQLADDFKATAVVGLGLDILPYLVAVESAPRIWYAGDEWVRHHVSQVNWSAMSTWHHVKDAAIRGLYERAFAGAIDRVWVVTPEERVAMRWLGGMRNVDVLSNGVDPARYAPGPAAQIPQSAVFWGRLDFGPNIQAVRWLCREIWPRVRQRAPEATLCVIGFSPTKEVVGLAAEAGITLISNADDVRPHVAEHAVAVLPFESGGGIKNKFLEAAAMGKAIVCTPRTHQGLRGAPPSIVVSRPDEWADALVGLWRDEARCRALGGDARQWVMREHSWEATARAAVRSLADARHTRGRSARVTEIEKTPTDAAPAVR